MHIYIDKRDIIIIVVFLAPHCLCVVLSYEQSSE